MSLADDLLRHARELAERAPSRPKQANIRRAISAAYYAVFHLLTRAAARQFVGDDELVVSRVARTFDHGKLLIASKGFAQGQLPQQLRKDGTEAVLPDKLRRIASDFVSLQQARHTADYDGEKRYERGDALDAASKADSIFENWSEIAQFAEAKLYLACFYLWDTWNKPPR